MDVMTDIIIFRKKAMQRKMKLKKRRRGSKVRGMTVI
jgi:hypothetical protein